MTKSTIETRGPGSGPNTLEEVKRLVERVLTIPADVSLRSVETHEALQPLHAKLGRVLGEIRHGLTEKQRAEVDRLRRVKCAVKRKHPGTSVYDTPEETWTAMRAAHLAGETLRSLSKRFGVIYDGVLRRRRQDGYRGQPWRKTLEQEWQAFDERVKARYGDQPSAANRGQRVDVDQVVEEARRAAYKAKAAYDRAQRRRHRTVRPEADGLAAVIELLPRRRRAEEPLIVPDPPGRSC